MKSIIISHIIFNKIKNYMNFDAKTINLSKINLKKDSLNLCSKFYTLAFGLS